MKYSSCDDVGDGELCGVGFVAMSDIDVMLDELFFFPTVQLDGG